MGVGNNRIGKVQSSELRPEPVNQTLDTLRLRRLAPDVSFPLAISSTTRVTSIGFANISYPMGDRMKRQAVVALIASTLALAACAPIELVSKYDNLTDDSASAMQKDLSAFFIKMDTAVTAVEASFAANQDFYRKQAVNISAMQLRAQNIPKNSLTVDQLQLVEDNLAYLALLHKGCVNSTLNEAQKAAIRARGIDASVGCRMDYGAISDSSDRGSSVLNPTLVPAVVRLFDSSLGAVMKLEIAKKRGEK